MQFILNAWTATGWQEDTFENLCVALDDPRLTAGLALVFGVQQVKYKGRLDRGKQIFQKYIFDSDATIPESYRRMAEDTIKASGLEKPKT